MADVEHRYESALSSVISVGNHSLPILQSGSIYGNFLSLWQLMRNWDVLGGQIESNAMITDFILWRCTEGWRSTKYVALVPRTDEKYVAVEKKMTHAHTFPDWTRCGCNRKVKLFSPTVLLLKACADRIRNCCTITNPLINLETMTNNTEDNAFRRLGDTEKDRNEGSLSNDNQQHFRLLPFHHVPTSANLKRRLPLRPYRVNLSERSFLKVNY